MPSTFDNSGMEIDPKFYTSIILDKYDDNPVAFHAHNNMSFLIGRIYALCTKGGSLVWESGLGSVGPNGDVNWGPITATLERGQEYNLYIMQSIASDNARVLGSIKFSLGSGGSGDAGPADGARPGPDGASGSGNPGPYPILVYKPDTEYFSGKDGTQKGITWDTGTGYYWAQIKGVGYKLIDNSSNTNYYSEYDPAHHGTGDAVVINLWGNCRFSRCSGFFNSLSWLSKSPDFSGNPASDSSPIGNRLNSASNYYNTFPVGGGIDGDAEYNYGRSDRYIILNRPATANETVTYYCKQQLGIGRGFGQSLAEIQFTIPRLDPLIKAVSNNTTWGSVYFLIADSYDGSSYTYGSTHYTERYVPVGTHIKLVAVPTSIGKFNKYTPGNITTLEYELDVTDDTTYTANFELGQFEIKVEKGNDIITSVSKIPSHSEGLAENWYLPNTEITIDAELKPSSDVAYYTFDSWKIGDEVVSTNKRNTFRANRSGTYTAYGKASNLKYKVIYNSWECSASIKNDVSGAIGDSVLAELGESLTLSCTPTSNYMLKGWKQRMDEDHDWEDLDSISIIAGNYHYFMPVLEPDGAECSILSPDEFNAIAQPIYQKSFKDYSKLVGVNQRWIGMKDPNSINWEEIKELGLTWDKEPELGDFFFMKKGGE